MSEVSTIENKIVAPKSLEAEKPKLDAILVFGQGPIIDQSTKLRAKDANTERDKEGTNFWSQDLAESASILYKKGETREIIIMGGVTGGEEYKSEAALIGQKLKELGVPDGAIKLEDESKNSLENLVNVLNNYIDPKKENYGSLGILGSNYHLPRLRLLMTAFGINYHTAFSSEEVLRYAAREGETWDNQKLLEIENRLNIADASKTQVSSKDSPASPYYEAQKGEESNNISERAKMEDVWTRSLLEIPEYWIGYIGRIDDPERIRTILEKQDPNKLKKHGIDLLEPNDVIKSKLLKIERKMPDVEDWKGKDWPKETERRLGEIRKDLQDQIEKK